MKYTTLLISLLSLGCAKGAAIEYPPAASASGDELPTARRATVFIHAAPAVELTGQGELTSSPQGVRTIIHVQHATPGKHAMVVSENGDCSSPGKPFGQLGDIDIAEDGKGEADVTIAEATLDHNGARSYVGKALVIRDKDPIACGVIEAVK